MAKKEKVIDLKSEKITDEQLKEVQDIYNNVMNQKDVWLQTTGTIDGSFSYKWVDKIELRGNTKLASTLSESESTKFSTQTAFLNTGP